MRTEYSQKFLAVKSCTQCKIKASANILPYGLMGVYKNDNQLTANFIK